jgi:LmbE family N-acetylglucosaminyl deacetylase
MSDASKPLRVMSIMAHQDDFEFNAGGTFALLREHYGNDVEMKIIATSRGASGHHEMSIEQTAARRDAEAKRSAAIIGAEYECLKQLDGMCVPMQVLVNTNFLGGLWNAIRDFEPDVVFCPPVATDPLAGVHVDHENTAIGLRYIAYQIGVPHAYPTTGTPKRRVRVPLFINVDDMYLSEGAGDFIRQDVSKVYDAKLDMALCHESQVFEWLPWTGGRDTPMTRDEVAERFKLRHQLVAQRYNCDDGKPSEFFRVTRWGRAAEDGELERLFPERIA